MRVKICRTVGSCFFIAFKTGEAPILYHKIKGAGWFDFKSSTAWISTLWPLLVHSCRRLPVGSRHTVDRYWEAEPNESGSSLLYTGSTGAHPLCNEVPGRTPCWWGWGLRPLCLEWWASCDRRSSSAVQPMWCCRRRAWSERKTSLRAYRCPASLWGRWHPASDRSFATFYRKCWQRCRPPRMGRCKGS